MPKSEKDCKGYWICESCGNVFEFLEAEEIEEVDGEVFPICPGCEMVVKSKQEKTPPKNYIQMGDKNIIHTCGEFECESCEPGYPKPCKCGGLQHRSYGNLKCDKCGRVS